jgi:hypothetical protein
MPTPELPIHRSDSRDHWERWLASNHSSSAGVWLKLAKKGSPTPSVTFADALDLALCFGWIDSQRLGHDEHFYLQRFTPRGSRSKWSQINRRAATELMEQGKMREAGLAQQVRREHPRPLCSRRRHLNYRAAPQGGTKRGGSRRRAPAVLASSAPQLPCRTTGRHPSGGGCSTSRPDA